MVSSVVLLRCDAALCGGKAVAAQLAVDVGHGFCGGVVDTGAGGVVVDAHDLAQVVYIDYRPEFATGYLGFIAGLGALGRGVGEYDAAHGVLSLWGCGAAWAKAKTRGCGLDLPKLPHGGGKRLTVRLGLACSGLQCAFLRLRGGCIAGLFHA